MTLFCSTPTTHLFSHLHRNPDVILRANDQRMCGGEIWLWPVLDRTLNLWKSYFDVCSFAFWECVLLLQFMYIKLKAGISVGIIGKYVTYPHWALFLGTPCLYWIGPSFCLQNCFSSLWYRLICQRSHSCYKFLHIHLPFQKSNSCFKKCSFGLRSGNSGCSRHHCDDLRLLMTRGGLSEDTDTVSNSSLVSCDI